MWSIRRVDLDTIIVDGGPFTDTALEPQTNVTLIHHNGSSIKKTGNNLIILLGKCIFLSLSRHRFKRPSWPGRLATAFVQAPRWFSPYFTSECLCCFVKVAFHCHPITTKLGCLWPLALAAKSLTSLTITSQLEDFLFVRFQIVKGFWIVCKTTHIHILVHYKHFKGSRAAHLSCSWFHCLAFTHRIDGDDGWWRVTEPRSHLHSVTSVKSHHKHNQTVTDVMEEDDLQSVLGSFSVLSCWSLTLGLFLRLVLTQQWQDNTFTLSDTRTRW